MEKRSLVSMPSLGAIEPESCLAKVFKLGRVGKNSTVMACHAMSPHTLENLAQVLSCQLKFVHDTILGIPTVQVVHVSTNYELRDTLGKCCAFLS